MIPSFNIFQLFFYPVKNKNMIGMSLPGKLMNTNFQTNEAQIEHLSWANMHKFSGEIWGTSNAEYQESICVWFHRPINIVV